MISVRHPHQTFHNLIFRPGQTRIYLSYPSTESRKTQEGIKEINRLRTRMHKIAKDRGLVIFDPVTMDETCV